MPLWCKNWGLSILRFLCFGSLPFFARSSWWVTSRGKNMTFFPSVTRPTLVFFVCFFSFCFLFSSSALSVSVNSLRQLCSQDGLSPPPENHQGLLWVSRLGCSPGTCIPNKFFQAFNMPLKHENPSFRNSGGSKIERDKLWSQAAYLLSPKMQASR